MSINLTKLEFAAHQPRLGDYCFFIDCEGHVADGLVADVLKNLVAHQAEVKFLGSYPVAGDDDAPGGVASRDGGGVRPSGRFAELQAGVRPTDDLSGLS